MSILRDFLSTELRSFGGAWLLPDNSSVDTRGALLSKNLQFVAGQVGTRFGFKAIPAAAAPGILPANVAITDMYCWYAPFSQIASTYSDSAIVLFYVVSPVGAGTEDLQIFNLKNGKGQVAGFGPVSLGGGIGMSGMSCVGVGMSLYAVYFDTNQVGGYYNPVTFVYSQQATIVTAYNNAGAVAYTVTPLWPGPNSFTFTPTEPGAGVVTAGVHRYGYLVEYDTGFTGRVAPDSSLEVPPSVTSFRPVSFTSAGAKNISIALNPGASGDAWRAGAVAVSIVMTTATNLNQYYIVPGTRTAVVPGTAAHTIVFDISDADLASQATDATPYLYWLTGTLGNPLFNFNLSHIALWGDRMAYKVAIADKKNNHIDALYVSERNNLQAITADQHLLQLPGKAPLTTMFRLGTTNYICGPHEIWAVTDNGDVPVSWPSPVLIDGKHGTLAVRGVEISPSQQYAWIADQSGLYVFDGGPINSEAISFLQSPDWDRINWDVAWCLKIKDNASQSRVHVLVALDSATTPSHIMSWDYSDGISSNTVRYSLDALNTYSIASMELFRNDLPSQATGNKKKIELWLGSNASAPLLRHMTAQDTNPYRDNGLAINSVWRSPPLPGRAGLASKILMHHGFSARLKGSGTVTPVMYDMDAARSFTCRSYTLATAPDEDPLFLADMRSEVACVEFNTNTVDTYWTLSSLVWYYSAYLMQR